MRNKTIALVDSRSDGHHRTFFLAYAEALLSLGNTVIALFPEPEALDGLKGSYPGALFPKRFDARLRSSSLPTKPLRLMANGVHALSHWKATRKAVAAAAREESLRIDCAFLMYVDEYMHPTLSGFMADAAFGMLWGGLYFQPRLHASIRERTRAVRWDGILAAKGCRFVLAQTYDESLDARMLAETGKKPYFFPEMTDERAPDQRIVADIRARAQGRKVVAMLGALSARKGMVELVDVIRKASPRRFFFVVAGPLQLDAFSPEERAKVEGFVANPPENCLLRLERIEDGPEFNAYVEASDVQFAAYRNFLQGSNLMTKAALFKRPIIVSAHCLMAEMAERYRLGAIVETPGPEAYIPVIEALAEGRGEDGRPLQARYVEYARLHSTAKLKEVLGSIEI